MHRFWHELVDLYILNIAFIVTKDIFDGLGAVNDDSHIGLLDFGFKDADMLCIHLIDNIDVGIYFFINHK